MRKTFLIFTLLFVVVAGAFAQGREFSVQSFEEKPFDTAARDERYKIVDGNGDLFSIIKLVSNNAGDDLRAYSFDFGLCESRIKEVDGDVWVYVQRNAMRATIKRAGYKTVKYELNTTVQPGKVYEMLLTAEALPVYREILQFNIKPVGVKATVMYKSTVPGAQLQFFGITDDEGSVAKSLELGTYIYEIHTDNYHKSEGRLELKEDNGTHIENVVLRPKFSTVTFEAGEGVDIYINDDKVGVGSWSGVLNAGTYTVECRKPKHKSVVEMIKIEENNDRVIELRSPVPQTGVLAVTSNPLGANIKVDGKDYGVTPKNIVDLLIGSHKVEISKKNYKSVVTTVEIREDETTECDTKLNKIANVTINSTPNGAHLYINGKRVGTTPKTMELESGDYNFRLTKESYHDFEKRVHVDISKPELNFSLKRQFQKKSGGYIEAAAQVGSLMGAGADAGAYIKGFNIEGYYLYGLKEEIVYVDYADGTVPEKNSPNAMCFGGKAGYGFVLGTRFRLTPQVGAGVVSIKSNSFSSSALTASAGLRCECALLGHLGLSVTPEYSFAVSKKEVFKKLEAVSSGIKGWGSGFNARVGLYVYF